MSTKITLRPYAAADEDAAIELWRRTWQKHYPHLNFTERVPWWRERWRKELVPVARVVVAEADGALIGFVTVDPETMYLDQIVVAKPMSAPSASATTTRATGTSSLRQRSRHQGTRSVKLRCG